MKQLSAMVTLVGKLDLKESKMVIGHEEKSNKVTWLVIDHQKGTMNHILETFLKHQMQLKERMKVLLVSFHFP